MQSPLKPNKPMKFDRLAVARCSPELQEALLKAEKKYNAMSTEDQNKMWEAQRESWVRGMMPTGDPRFD